MSLKELEKLSVLSKLTGLTRLADLVPLYYKLMNEVDTISSEPVYNPQ